MEEAKTKFDFVLDEDEYGEFCVVPLSGGKYFAKIDPEDYPEISRYSWQCKRFNGKTKYARRGTTITKNGERKSVKILMHRQIMKVADGVALDHINGDGHDNRKANLRIADVCQNQWNQKIRTGGTSKYKGVAWHKRGKKWRVTLQYRGKQMHLGCYVGEVEAARAYDRAAVKYFGVFARLNFPEDAQMSYCLDEKTKKTATKKILELKNYSGAELAEILANMSVAELGDMCRVLQCNISELSKKIRKGIIP